MLLKAILSKCSFRLFISLPPFLERKREREKKREREYEWKNTAQTKNNCCCCSVSQLCLTLCDPIDCSTPGFPVLHHLSELVQTHIHWVGDAIQPSHSLSSPSPPTFNPSQHQGLASSGQSIGVSSSASVLPMNIQDWLLLGLTGWSLCSPRDSQESCPTPQFKGINSSVLSLLYGPTLISIHDYWKNHSFDYTDFCHQQNNVSAF